jgi:hypothetical protein
VNHHRTSLLGALDASQRYFILHIG